MKDILTRKYVMAEKAGQQEHGAFVYILADQEKELVRNEADCTPL